MVAATTGVPQSTDVIANIAILGPADASRLGPEAGRRSVSHTSVDREALLRLSAQNALIRATYPAKRKYVIY